MQDYEKLGSFYLGRHYDLANRKLQDDLVLYDSNDLTTHAVCVGMTGSGKTGLCLALLEEAAIDGIPAILVDPKGDLGNLLLTFPRLAPEDFLPWIDPAEAARQGLEPGAFAQQTAHRWQDGLAAWQQDGGRIQRFCDAVDRVIYTPGSTAGLPLTVLRSFAAPPPAIRNDDEALRERIVSSVSGLLALLEVNADPLQSREHILLSQILDRSWRAGADLDLGGLIRAIQSPPIDRVGMIDLETFFPAKDRVALAMQLNNLLASPGFAGWLQGEPLDIQRLLYTPEGKPRISILSIAHLSDNERMFFLTILLGELLAWVRRQAGTPSLRALFYMDEVFGYFPPSANPPSKKPMLTLLKQARAFGLGVVLATQNPVDLDYKGLANAGTWFLGRLQTERDKLRVLEGLEGAATAAGSTFDRGAMDTMLSGLGNRVFLMNNVHLHEPVVFQSRWVLSYLRGPLTRGQIQTLMESKKQAAISAATPAGVTPVGTAPVSGVSAVTTATASQRPILPAEAGECFVLTRGSAAQATTYQATLLGKAKVHFTDAKRGVDVWKDLAVVAPLSDTMPDDPWAEAEVLEAGEIETEKQTPAQARFASTPPEIGTARNYAKWKKDLQAFLYRGQEVQVWACASLKKFSEPDEAEDHFRIRVSQECRETRDRQIAELRERHASKYRTLDDQIRRAGERVSREKAQQSQRTLDTVISMGSAVVGALLGGRKVFSSSTISKATTAARSASRIARDSQEVGQANESLEVLQQRKADLDAQVQEEIQQLETVYSPQNLACEAVSVRPKKTDITVDAVVLAWRPL